VQPRILHKIRGMFPLSMGEGIVNSEETVGVRVGVDGACMLLTVVLLELVGACVFLALV